MKIKSLRVKNFLSFKNEQTINFDNHLNVIVGPNNSGKTNLIRALNFINQAFFTYDIKDISSYYYNGDSTNPFEVELGVEFNADESRIILDFIICSIVSTPMNMDILKQKGYTSLDRINTEDEINLTSNTTMENKERFAEFVNTCFKKITLVAIGNENKEHRLFLKLSGTKPLILHLKNNFIALSNETTWGKQFSIGDLIMEDYPVRDSGSNTPSERPLFDLIYNKLSTESGSIITIASPAVNSIRMSNYAIYPIYLKLLSFLKSKNIGIGDSITLSTVLQALIENSIISISDSRAKPKEFVQLNEDLSLLNWDSGAIKSDALTLLLFKLKNSALLEDRNRYDKIKSKFKEMYTDMSFDITIRYKEIPQDKHAKTIEGSNEFATGTTQAKPGQQQDHQYELLISIIRDKFQIPLNLSSAGVFEVLFLLAIIIGQTNKVIFLDEPALNLHPNMQRRIIELIQNSANNQFIIITHSSTFITKESIPHLWRFCLNQGGTKNININELINGSNLPKEDKKDLSIQLEKEGVRDILFSQGVILAEGPSDKISLQLLDKHLSDKGIGANLEDKEWMIISIDGKKSLSKFINAMQLLSIPWLAVCDEDAMMNIEESINDDNKKIDTSVIFLALNAAGVLQQPDINSLREKRKNIKENIDDKQNKKRYYHDSEFDTLFKIAKKYKIYVLKGNLEDNTAVSKENKRKPLKNLEAIETYIKQDNIPCTLKNVIEFIAKEIKEYEEGLGDKG